MARLPWLTSGSLRKSSDSSKKKKKKKKKKKIYIFREVFLIYHKIVCFVYSLELPHRGDYNEYIQHIIIM